MKYTVEKVTIEMTPQEALWLATVLNHTGGKNEVVLVSVAKELDISFNDLKQVVHEAIGVFRGLK